jgi:prepilin-type N-terminal cleavage/methylation domain-containing protein
MKRQRRATVRGGFTLLEVLLATSIGLLLLVALYMSFEIYISHVDQGRRQIEQGTLARSLFTHLEADLSACVPLSDPGRYRAQQSQQGQGGATTPTTGDTTTGDTSGTGGSTTATGGLTTNTVALPLSVQGDSTTLHIFITRTPRELFVGDSGDSPPVVSDLRRVSYWMIDSGGKKGLARQEVKQATSEDALTNLPPGVADEETFIIADEVRSVQFRYWDGTAWNDSWDCTTLGADGVTPVGPPRAIEITVELALPQGTLDTEERTRTYRHVVSLLTADGAPASTGTTTGTTGGGSTP